MGGGNVLIGRLREIVGPEHTLEGAALDDYAHDATFLEFRPLAAVRPADSEQVAAVVRLCSQTRTPLTTRGAGSGLAGGPVPLAGGIVVSTERLTQLEIDHSNLVAVAGAGVITGQLDEAAARYGLYYPPDPASRDIATIGGNVACNAGGLHCLKYGLTADYVVGMKVVLADGSLLELGGRLRKRASGYRLMALFVGSEGTLGIVTEVTVKLIPRPTQHATAMVGFATIEEAAEAVTRVLGSGSFPAALELMNREALTAVAEYLPPGFKPNVEAVLIVEQDGNDAENVLSEVAAIVELMGGVDDRIAQSAAEREGIWKARRHFGEVIRSTRENHFSEDVAVPISAVPEMVRRFQALAERNRVGMPTVGHAGDGNLHPVLHFDDEQRALVGPLAAQIYRDAVDLGGTISAEHGLGALKRDFAALEHSPLEIEWWRRLKQTFDPLGILNPHKVFPEQPADDNFIDKLPGWATSRRSEIAT